MIIDLFLLNAQKARKWKKRRKKNKRKREMLTCIHVIFKKHVSYKHRKKVRIK